MLGRTRVKSVLDTRLPPFDRPRCQVSNCNSPLDEPRPILMESQGAAGVMTVHCLAKCPVCGAQYKGERRIGLGKKTRALEQDFHFFTDEDRAFVSGVLAKYQQDPARLAKINAMNVKG